MVARAWQLLDTPYIWGGKQVLKQGGLDCSGLVEDCLRTALGRLPYNKVMASYQQLEWWSKRVVVSMDHEGVPDPAGFLVYYLNSKETRVAHVEICISKVVSIGARGDSFCTSPEKAKIRDARVKCRATFGRTRKIAGIINPFAIFKEV